jgi:hypothetical protein
LSFAGAITECVGTLMPSHIGGCAKVQVRRNAGNKGGWHEGKSNDSTYLNVFPQLGHSYADEGSGKREY